MAVFTVLCAVCWVIAAVTGSDWAAIAAIAFGSVEAIRAGIATVRLRRIDVNVLMLLAGGGATAIGRHFDAATLLMLFSLSSTLEAFALGRTERGIESLVKLRPQTAVKSFASGETRTVPVEELEIGDALLVDAFSQFPADGELTSGSTSVDESIMTGEATPVAKAVGDFVMSGTQNLEGSVTIRVTAAASASTIDRVIALVKEARENKAKSERIGAWFGQTYTIGVIAASLTAYAIRYVADPGDPFGALYSSLVFLVALSPCALVISTPAAILSALAFAARHGILVRGGAALEAAGRIRAAALDKTGTLTMGRFRLVAAAIVDEHGIERWEPSDEPSDAVANALKLAAAVEARAAHPLADAIVAAANERGIGGGDAQNVRVEGGKGVVGTVCGGQIKIGRAAFFDTLPATVRDAASEFEAQGATTVVMSVDDQHAIFALADTPRPNAGELASGLRKAGVLRIAVLTGDNVHAAEAVARAVGIAEVHAALLPGEKQEIVERIRRETGPVVMVGDGVNDAPSLAAADLGVAMGGLGSDVAIRSADAVIVQDRLDRIPLLISLGKRASRIVRQNVAVSIGSIVVLAALSLSGSLPLGVAVLGHEGTTVVVILNGLRLLARP